VPEHRPAHHLPGVHHGPRLHLAPAREPHGDNEDKHPANPIAFPRPWWHDRPALLEDSMKKVTYEHLIPASIEKVIEAYAQDDFYILKLKNSGATTVEVLEREEQPGNRLRRKCRATEPSRVPAMLRKSETDTYVDDNVLDRNGNVMTWKVTPNMMADKFLLSGSVEFHPAGAQTKVVFNTQLEVKIPLIGGKAEQIGLEKTAEEVARQAAFLKDWVAKH
jgi:hypothetical protein